MTAPSHTDDLGADETAAVRAETRRALRRECCSRITAAYAATDIDDEILKRIGDRHTPEQNAERERLRTVYRTLQHRIDAMPLTDLHRLDVTADAHWQPTLDD